MENKNQTTNLNFDELLSMCSNNQDFFKEMLETFCKSMNQATKAIQQHLEKKDWTGLANSAHKVAPSCHHISASKLYEMLKELEDRARNEKELNTIHELINSVKEEAENVIEKVQLKIKELE